MFFVSYCRPSKFNKNIPKSSHTSAPSYAPIKTAHFRFSSTFALD